MLGKLWEEIRSIWVDSTPLERTALSIWLPIYALAWVLAYLFGE